MKKSSVKKEPVALNKTGGDYMSGPMLLSHQLMSTLTAMKWSLKMLADGDFGRLSKEQKSIVEKIDQKNDLLVSLANRVLHTAMLESGSYCCNQSLVDMESIITSIIAYDKEGFAKKSIVVKFKKLAEKIPLFSADAEMLKIVIQNIFDNAIKYTLPGGTVKIFLDFDGKNIYIKVQDSGIGVPEKQKSKLFHKFFRADNAIGLNPAGSGLGLFICKSIIRAHGGNIGFESKENEGSVFYVSLPTTMAMGLNNLKNKL